MSTQVRRLGDQHLIAQHDLYRRVSWRPDYHVLIDKLRADQRIEMLDLCQRVLSQAVKTWAKPAA